MMELVLHPHGVDTSILLSFLTTPDSRALYGHCRALLKKKLLHLVSSVLAALHIASKRLEASSRTLVPSSWLSLPLITSKYGLLSPSLPSAGASAPPSLRPAVASLGSTTILGLILRVCVRCLNAIFVPSMAADTM